MSTVTLNRARLAPPEFTRRRLQQQMQQQMAEPAPVPGYHLPPPSIEALARRAAAVARERNRVPASTAGR
jgi:hypothetical protein